MAILVIELVSSDIRHSPEEPRLRPEQRENKTISALPAPIVQIGEVDRFKLPSPETADIRQTASRHLEYPCHMHGVQCIGNAQDIFLPLIRTPCRIGLK